MSMHKRLRRHVEECLGRDREPAPGLHRLLRRIEREYRRADELRASLRHALGLLSGLLQTPRAARRVPAEPPGRPAPAPSPQGPSASLLCDGDRMVTYWSPPLEKLLGIAAADALGRELAMLLYPGNDLREAQARTALRQALLGEGTRRLPLVRDDAALELVLVPLAAPDGSEAGRAGLVFECDALADRLARAWEAAGDVIWDWNVPAGRLWLSPAWQAIAGAAPGGEVAPADWLDRVHPEDREAVAVALRAHLEGDAPRFESAHRLRCADGSWRPVLARGRATRDGAGKPLRFCGSLVDLSTSNPPADAPPASPDAPAALDQVPVAAPAEPPSSDGEADAPYLCTVEPDLRFALARRQLRVEYLPVVSVATGQIRGLEALLRWAHPTHGLLAAAQFMPFAEETGLIVPIGRWMLEEAARDFRRCAHFVEGLKLHVNVSPQQLQHPGLLEDLEGVLAHRGLAPQALVLEIAEGSLEDGRHSQRITELHARGFGLSVDDFGTGSCTIDSLFRFPFDSLKIDRSLFGGGPRGQAPELVRSIVALARESNAEAIAEGVETAEQLAFVRELGCAAAQGFFLSPPVDGHEARALLARSTCVARTA